MFWTSTVLLYQYIVFWSRTLSAPVTQHVFNELDYMASVVNDGI